MRLLTGGSSKQDPARRLKQEGSCPKKKRSLTYLPICLSVDLSIYLSIYLSIHLYMYVCFYIYIYVHRYVCRLYTYVYTRTEFLFPRGFICQRGRGVGFCKQQGVDVAQGPGPARQVSSIIPLPHCDQKRTTSPAWYSNVKRSLSCATTTPYYRRPYSVHKTHGSLHSTSNSAWTDIVNNSASFVLLRPTFYLDVGSLCTCGNSHVHTRYAICAC